MGSTEDRRSAGGETLLDKEVADKVLLPSLSSNSAERDGKLKRAGGKKQTLNKGTNLIVRALLSEESKVFNQESKVKEATMPR